MIQNTEKWIKTVWKQHKNQNNEIDVLGYDYDYEVNSYKSKHKIWIDDLKSNAIWRLIQLKSIDHINKHVLNKILKKSDLKYKSIHKTIELHSR